MGHNGFLLQTFKFIVDNNIGIRLTDYVELSPSWEAANCAAPQELPSILCNPKGQYRVHKSPPLVPFLSQIDPVHTNPSYLSKIHFNIMTYLKRRLSSGLDATT
jgi:hypothetical protein